MHYTMHRALSRARTHPIDYEYSVAFYVLHTERRMHLLGRHTYSTFTNTLLFITCQTPSKTHKREPNAFMTCKRGITYCRQTFIMCRLRHVYREQEHVYTHYTIKYGICCACSVYLGKKKKKGVLIFFSP